MPSARLQHRAAGPDPGARTPVHLAIVQRPFLRMILAGTKTAEARLGKTRRLPYTGLETGHTIYFKPPGGDLAAVARAGRVHRFELAGTDDVHAIRDRFDTVLGGVAAENYWERKADARFATIVELVGVTPIERAPAWYRPVSNRSAWRLLRAG